jgi:hypothetical protein
MDGQILMIVLAGLMFQLSCCAGEYCGSPALGEEAFNGKEGSVSRAIRHGLKVASLKRESGIGVSIDLLRMTTQFIGPVCSSPYLNCIPQNQGK